MCETCGCGITDSTAGNHSESIRVIHDLMHNNDHQAKHNREHFDRHGVLAINLMSSPGAGKTRLLEATIDALGDSAGLLVIEGDLETENDAARIRNKGVPAVQITTGNACHLDASMVHEALHDISLDGVNVLFIENVGNLVCPAAFDLGQHLNVVMLSVTEGDDKPAKYPVMFRTADVIIVSKCDLLQVIDDFDPARASRAIADLGRKVPVIHTATGKAESIGPWLDWLSINRSRHQPAAMSRGTV